MWMWMWCRKKVLSSEKGVVITHASTLLLGEVCALPDIEIYLVDPKCGEHECGGAVKDHKIISNVVGNAMKEKNRYRQFKTLDEAIHSLQGEM